MTKEVERDLREIDRLLNMRDAAYAAMVGPLDGPRHPMDRAAWLRIDELDHEVSVARRRLPGALRHVA